MTRVASKVLTVVNAPYRANLSARRLAACISDLEELKNAYGPAFAFYTDVNPEHQRAFVKEMGLSEAAVRAVAQHIAGKVPYGIALAD